MMEAEIHLSSRSRVELLTLDSFSSCQRSRVGDLDSGASAPSARALNGAGPSLATSDRDTSLSHFSCGSGGGPFRLSCQAVLSIRSGTTPARW